MFVKTEILVLHPKYNKLVEEKLVNVTREVKKCGIPKIMDAHWTLPTWLIQQLDSTG